MPPRLEMMELVSFGPPGESGDLLERFGRAKKKMEGRSIQAVSLVAPLVFGLSVNMSMSLRKKLSRRQTEDKSKLQDHDANIPPDELDVTEGLSHDAIAAFDFGDLSTIPQPPAPTIRRVSSPSSLHRYKARAAAGIPPTVSPARSQVAYRTAFTENFDKTASEPVTAADGGETTPWDAVKDTIMASGSEQDQSTSSTEGSAKRRSSVDMLGRARSISSGNPTIRRVTRSKSRREERQDSATDAVQAGKDDRKTTTASESEDELVRPPPGLNFNHAKQLPRTPSPQHSDDGLKSGIVNGTAAPTNSASFSLPFKFGNDRRKDNVPAASTYVHQTTSSGGKGILTDSSINGDDSLYPDPLAISPPPAKKTTPTPIDLNGYTIPALLKNENEPLPPAIVPVCPPLFNPTHVVSQHWTDQKATTSRPDVPWGWSRRWTCCQCSAQTIVEQKSCARLRCGHGRCAGRCKIIVKATG